MISFNKQPGQRVLELGCGANRQPVADVAVDVRLLPGVDFACDFNREEWPEIGSEEFDAVLALYVLEHVSWRLVPSFLRQVLRVLKPGGKAVFLLPNGEAQIQWFLQNQSGWDGRDAFASISGLLYGDQDYPENSHRAFFSPSIVSQLFQAVGFKGVLIQSAGERKTDMLVEAMKSAGVVEALREMSQQNPMPQVPLPPEGRLTYPKKPQEAVTSWLDPSTGSCIPPLPEQLFDKHYFNGGGKVGGYAREGYWDYPVHHVTAKHVLTRKPESVLEVGCARGYIVKRLQDAGLRANGLEVSSHCWLSRVAEGIIRKDIGETPWPYKGEEFDLCFSIATLEHIPESKLAAVIREMARTCRRGLHGIDFGQHDDGFDKTHCTLKPKDWWEAKFRDYAPGWPVEIVDKEELEKGEIPSEILRGDGKVKLNIGSFTTMSHWGWVNLDLVDLTAWAGRHGYQFRHHDVRKGIPYGTGEVDLIFSCHMLEHLTYAEGKAFLRECRRVLRPEGALRIVVPDAKFLMSLYMGQTEEDYYIRRLPITCLADLDEINDGCAQAPTDAGKLWSLLHEGHNSCYDDTTLAHALAEAGFQSHHVGFRGAYTAGSEQILRETLDMMPCLSLYMDAVPKTD